MKFAEIRAREDWQATMVPAIEQGLTYFTRTDVRCVSPGSTADDLWREPAMLSCLLTRRAARLPRKWAADSFRLTANRRRRVPQYVAGSLAASRAAFRLAPLRIATTSAGRAIRDLVLVPGNRTVRVHDFASQRSGVWLKRGFDPVPFEADALRRANPSWPFVPVVEHGPGWLIEPLLDAVPLSRIADAATTRDAVAQVAAILAELRSATSEAVDAAAEGSRLVQLIVDNAVAMGEGPSAPIRSVRGPLDTLRRVACDVNEWTTVLTHGDLQAGNVLIERRSGDVKVIDWEYSARRWHHYDSLVLALQLRRAPGLAERIRTFVADGTVSTWLSDLPRWTRQERARAAAATLLEELVRATSEYQREPHHSMPLALLTLVDSLVPLTDEIRRVANVARTGA